ncbi:MAG TPA: hypothetical protein VLK89_04340 [Solirubrobacterales bacterium]|nr:hypothetical protein [Solirubrobacterales bacterium]
MQPRPSLHSAVLTSAGVLLIAFGIFVHAGWPFVLGGFVLLMIAMASRRPS